LIATGAAGFAALALVVLPGAAANASVASSAPSGAVAATAPGFVHAGVGFIPAGVTSEFTIYSGLNYGGRKTVLTGCGNHNFPYALKSYVWLGLGQSGNLYNVKNGAGKIQFTLPTTGTVKSGQANGWESIFIVC
jgi:hypothetical protein